MKSNIRLKSNIILKKSNKNNYLQSLVPYEALPRSMRDVRSMEKLTKEQEIQMERYLYKASKFEDRDD